MEQRCECRAIVSLSCSVLHDVALAKFLGHLTSLYKPLCAGQRTDYRFTLLELLGPRQVGSSCRTIGAHASQGTRAP
eukprot:4193066-Pyramimonas_sp.AAC.1